MRAGWRGWQQAAWESVFAALCVGCVWPLFYVRHPPIQDLPQHLAAVRVLHDFSNPAFGFEQIFELSLFDTQYLAYYVAAHVLAFLVGVELANRLLLAAALAGIAYATRALLIALGKDGRLALLVLPLSYSAHLILGFLNFVAAIPLAIYGVAMAVRLRRGYSHARAAGLAALLLACFYTHVMPFALLALGVSLIGLARDWRVALRAWWPLLPSLAAASLWLRISPAGQATAEATLGTAGAARPDFQPAAVALQQLPRWLTDVLEGGDDLRLLQIWVALILSVFALSAFDFLRRATRPDPIVAHHASAPPAPGRLERQLGLRLWSLPAVCAIGYFLLPAGYAWIWPISPRLALLCALWVVPLLPRFSSGRALVLAAAIGLSSASFHLAGSAFASFEREDVGDFEQALRELPPRRRVVGLIFDRYSAHVAFAPFIHYVAYYQVRKGGSVMFTFADFPQSPFRFRSEHRPPRVPPRWEWMPQRVRPAELRFYDYALVRGGPGLIGRADSGFQPIYRGERWSVWRQRGRQ